MLYTFLIASRRQTLAARGRIRTVSTVASNEVEARNRFNGLRLVFVSRKPTGGAL